MFWKTDRNRAVGGMEAVGLWGSWSGKVRGAFPVGSRAEEGQFGGGTRARVTLCN